MNFILKTKKILETFLTHFLYLYATIKDTVQLRDILIV